MGAEPSGAGKNGAGSMNSASPPVQQPAEIFVQAIQDCQGKSYPLFLRSQGDRHCLMIYDGAICVGQARYAWQGNGVLTLDDIAIANRVPTVPNAWQRLQQRLFKTEPPAVSYRQRGLGKALLASILDQGQRLGATVLLGEVFQPDVDNNPDLLAWYQRRGFQATPPTPGEDSEDLLAKISLPLSPPQTP
ncbi:MAG: GNAT family N-acetyltransferase [Synechococcales cyanobacterium RM1_1_8]|nr:GNAT family N-acetyltransferase [Synechococcales cyanobacterium RM1_1_8]